MTVFHSRIAIFISHTVIFKSHVVIFQSRTVISQSHTSITQTRYVIFNSTHFCHAWLAIKIRDLFGMPLRLVRSMLGDLWQASLHAPYGCDTELDKRNSKFSIALQQLQISWRKEQAWFNFVSTKVFLMRRFLCARQVKRDRFNHIPWLNKRWRSSHFISNFISGWLSSRCFLLWLQVSSV